jgi:biopolymer transport protein ExbD
MAIGARQRMVCLKGMDPHAEDENVNLVPIMNLFVVLIPFLLLSAAFFHISVINASVPALQKDRNDLAKTDVAVTMMVRMLPEAFKITASSDVLARSELDELRAEIPREGEGKGFQEFSNQLFACKQRYPKSDTMLLVPDASIEYQEVIRAMDAGRWMDTLEEGEKVRYELFPNVVISGML